jgi:hypothetical protein
MIRKFRLLVAFVAIVGLGMPGVTVFAAPKEKDAKPMHEKGQKAHKHKSGKDLLGDRVKKNGSHKLEDHGKNSATAEVKDGKITGVKVKHADKGDVPVTKYKSNTKMASGPATSRYQLASLGLAPAQYVGTMWIGYAYIDDYGDEIIYWFPYDMIYDGDTGAIEYYPA